MIFLEHFWKFRIIESWAKSLFQLLSFLYVKKKWQKGAVKEENMLKNYVKAIQGQVSS